MKAEGKVGEWSVDRWQGINKGIACFAEFALIKKRRGAMEENWEKSAKADRVEADKEESQEQNG